MIRSLFTGLLCLLCLGAGLPAQGRAEVLTVGGTGSSSPLVQLLFDEFRKQAPDVTLRIIDPPLGTNGALKALAAGRVDIVMAGRPISPEEYKTYGEHFDFADTPFVMASRDGRRAQGFTLDQLAEVYEGRLQQWDTGAPIRLVLRGSFESDTLLLKTMGPRMEKAVPLAGQRPGMAGAVNDIATAKLLAEIPGSLGPTTLGLLTTLGLRITVFALDGVTPSTANLKKGSYPWRKTLTVVLPHAPSPAARSFAAFLRSPKAHAVMLRNDYLPLAR